MESKLRQDAQNLLKLLDCEILETKLDTTVIGIRLDPDFLLTKPVLANATELRLQAVKIFRNQSHLLEDVLGFRLLLALALLLLLMALLFILVNLHEFVVLLQKVGGTEGRGLDSTVSNFSESGELPEGKPNSAHASAMLLAHIRSPDLANGFFVPLLLQSEFQGFAGCFVSSQVVVPLDFVKVDLHDLGWWLVKN